MGQPKSLQALSSNEGNGDWNRPVWTGSQKNMRIRCQTENFEKHKPRIEKKGFRSQTLIYHICIILKIKNLHILCNLSQLVPKPGSLTGSNLVRGMTLG